MRFCPECNNMMYEQEDRGERKLVYKCLHCGSAPEVADNPVVYHNEINAEAAGASASKFVNYGADRTLPRSRFHCPECGNREAVYFYGNVNTKERTFTIYLACMLCSYHLVM